MKKYTVCFPGLPKTASHSLHKFFINHPEVSSSIKKENLMDRIVRLAEPPYYDNKTRLGFENYLDGYKLKNETRVLCDGSVGVLFYLSNLVQMMYEEKFIERICCIYIYRNSIDRFFSTVNNLTRLYLLDKTNQTKPRFLDENSLKVKNEELKRWFDEEGNQTEALYRIEKQVGSENLLIIPLSKVEENKNKIYNFLKIDQNQSTKFPKEYQASKLKFSLETLKVKLDFIKWFKMNFEMMVNSSKRDEIKILDKWGVDVSNEKYNKRLYREYFSIY